MTLRLQRRVDLRPHMPAPVNALAGHIAVLPEDEVRSVDREVLRCAYSTRAFRLSAEDTYRPIEPILSSRRQSAATVSPGSMRGSTPRPRAATLINWDLSRHVSSGARTAGVIGLLRYVVNRTGA